MGREPCSDLEPIVADRLEAIMPAEGITPGARECHDAQPGQHRVDWVYPDAGPMPIALEVTSLVAAVDKKGTAAAATLSRSLSIRAEAEELGGWIVAVNAERDLRSLEREIAKILQDATKSRERLLETEGFIRPGIYTDADLMRLPRSEWGSFIAEHERVRELGIVELKPTRGIRDHFVWVLPTQGGPVGPFSDELHGALEAKRETLGLEQDLERHLGVWVDRWDVSNEPAHTPAPELPPEIDVLWVVHRWRESFDEAPVWVVRRRERSWRVHAN